LSTRINNIQKEMNPYISMSGMAQGQSKSVYIDRVTSWLTTVATSNLDVKSSDLKTILPDGCKILSMKITNLDGRAVTATVPAGSGLILVESQSSVGAQNEPLTRVNYAPLSRFPSIKMEIPDLIARNIDTDSTSVILFNVGIGLAATNQRVMVRFHYKIAI